MKKKSKLMNVFLNLSLIIIGLIVGIAIGNYGNIPFQQEVNIVELAGLFVTVFLAVYVPAVLDRQLQSLRDRNDLLESRIEDYQSFLRRINMIVQEDRSLQGNEPLTLINLLDISGHRINTLASLIKNSRFDASFSKDITAIRKVNDQHRDLLLPEGKPVENYGDDIRKQEEELYFKLDEMTSLLILKISEAK